MEKIHRNEKGGFLKTKNWRIKKPPERWKYFKTKNSEFREMPEGIEKYPERKARPH